MDTRLVGKRNSQFLNYLSDLHTPETNRTNFCAVQHMQRQQLAFQE
jgi:hypothetical protein